MAVAVAAPFLIGAGLHRRGADVFTWRSPSDEAVGMVALRDTDVREYNDILDSTTML